MIKLLVLLLLTTTHIYSANRLGTELLEVIDYIKVVDDSIEITLKTKCKRKIFFDASPIGKYINTSESEIIEEKIPRKYYDQLQLLELTNYNSSTGEHFSGESLFNIKINTTEDNLYYYMPTLKNMNIMWHVKALLGKSGYRSFYLLNSYGTDFRASSEVVTGEGVMTLKKPRQIGFKVKYSGYIYIPRIADDTFEQFGLKLEVLSNQVRDFYVVRNSDAVIIVLPAYYSKSSVAP